MGHRFGLSSLVVVAAGAFALGAWFFRAKAVQSVASSVPPGRSVVAAPAPAPTHSPASNTTRDDMLGTLRAKLSGSLEEVLGALAEIGKTNPALAIDLAHELGRTDREKATWVTNAMQAWADRDPASAWQWLRQLTNDRMQELAGGELGSVVLGAMAARDPQLVIAQLDSLLRGGNASESISTSVAVHLGLTALVEHGDLSLAKSVVDAWARDPSQLRLEAAALETVSVGLAGSQPREAGEWLRSLPASDERNAAFATFAAAWGKQDPRSALQWAESLSPNEGQVAALRRTVSDWIEEHPDAVSSWLGDHLTRVPPGPSSDTLIETMINNSPTLRTAPSAALQWAGLISDPVKQVDYYERIALRWAEQDASAALEFVTKSAVIPSERKTSVMQKIQLSQSAARSGG